MENASKALIIAGSVLVAIILIAIGVRVINSTSGTTKSVADTMTASEKATFNSKFTAYAGSGKSGAQVKALANIVISNNATNPNKKVKFMGSDNATTITNKAATYNSGNYTISVTIDENTGLVTSITIS